MNSEEINLTDSHAHIYGDEFRADFDAMLARAKAAGVRTIVTVGADLESSRMAVQLAAAHENIYAAVGIHPHDASGVSGGRLRRNRSARHEQQQSCRHWRNRA